jgi:proline dehydrogenase
MFDTAAKTFFHLLARSTALKNLASRYGMRKTKSFARRFIAGESIDEAIAAASIIQSQGLLQTLAQLGLSVNPARATDNMRRILDAADGFFIRIDMESSPYTQTTLDIFERLWQQGYRHVGVVLQSDLHRTERDVERMNALGARVRLVKGAYKEPKSIAYQRKADVDAAFVREMKALLTEGHYPAIATHDPSLIDVTRRFAADKGIPADRFEFQLLYGIRRDLQLSLVKQGYRVRIYIPFGRQWFPYFMRRLGERPANVAFVLRSLIREGAG